MNLPELLNGLFDALKVGALPAAHPQDRLVEQAPSFLWADCLRQPGVQEQCPVGK